MKSEKKRFTIDLDVSFQRRLKVIAALKGVSMRRYCIAAIEKELTLDQAVGAMALPSGEQFMQGGAQDK